MPPDWPHIFELPRTEKWRVKLCRLGQESWTVFGEGDIEGEFDAARNEYRLVVRDDADALLFETAVSPPVAFQKQDSLLLWNGPARCVKSDPADPSAPASGPARGANRAADAQRADADTENCPRRDRAAGEDARDELVRIAIGFQAAAGCASISEFILYAAAELKPADEVPFAVQHPGSEAGFEGFAEVVEKPLTLPPLPTPLNLTIVRNTMSDLLASLLGREFLIVYLDAKQYLDRLWDVFVEITAPLKDAAAKSRADASPFERMQMLWTLSDIVKQYFLVGDSYLIEGMTDAQRFTRVLQMLEYDRTFGTRKANFEHYYRRHTALKQVVQIPDAPVVEKIRSTFRLQLLRDVLVRSADDFTFHILRTLIYVNYSEILEKLQSSPAFCDELFALFDSDRGSDVKDDAIRFINEVMLASKTFVFSQLRLLYLTLVDSGLIRAISYGLAPERPHAIKMLALESLSTLMDFDSSLILPFRDSIVAAIVTLASNEALSPSVRAIQIETAELLKKILLDIPAETFPLFFTELRAALAIQRPREVMLTVLLPFLDILTHSFACNPEATGELMQQYGIWQRIAAIYRAEPADDNNHLDAHISMALTRLVREAVQPPAAVTASHAADQARCILDFGLFQALVARHIREFARRPGANDAEQSSFLNLLYVIIEGRNSAAQQFKPFIKWMTTDGMPDMRLLCERYPPIAGLLPEIAATSDHDLLKRPSSRQGGPLGHYAQRPRLAPQQRQIVDEVDEVDDGDVFTLPSGNFSSHFRQDAFPHETTESLGAHLPGLSANLNGAAGVSLAGSLHAGEASGSAGLAGTTPGPSEAQGRADRQRSPSPPPHPWWDARHGLENEELSEKVTMLRRPVPSVRSQR